MPSYLNHTFDANNPDLISVVDELPLWSAPFGLRLLEKVNLKKGINFLDIGCGEGFPLVELAQRLGNSSTGYGLDPWEMALGRIELKIKTYGLQNIRTIKGVAESIPFEDGFFDLIVSNNGINNVQDLPKTLFECARVSKQGAQFIVTFNLDETMNEFYTAFKESLLQNGLNDEIAKVNAHIYEKRRPVEEINNLLEKSGFKINEVQKDCFSFRYLDAEAMFSHSFIKYWFLGSWKAIVPPELLEKVFKETEEKINSLAQPLKGIQLTIPFVTIDCEKV